MPPSIITFTFGFITQINPNIRQRQIAEKEYQENGSYYIFKIPNNKVGGLQKIRDGLDVIKVNITPI